MGVAATFAVILLGMALLGLLVTRPTLLSHSLGPPPAARRWSSWPSSPLPLVSLMLGTGVHLEAAKSTDFCLSCHVMEPYGESLLADDAEMVPAHHFQDHLVPEDLACFTCHTDYAMYGDLKAKVRGLRHLWVNYLGAVPETLELYEPYKNRECLHCHAGARSYEESELHLELREDLFTEEVSCLECHDRMHAVDELADLPRWSVPQEAQEVP